MLLQNKKLLSSKFTEKQSIMKIYISIIRPITLKCCWRRRRRVEEGERRKRRI
jgi:hypothetical protein